MSRAIAGVAAGQALAQLLVVGAQQALVLLVAHRVDPRAQGLAAVALEERAQAPPVLDRLGVPAGRLEHPHEAPGGDVGHDAVQRLAVEVDDPQHLAQRARPSGRRSPPTRRPRRARRRPAARSGARRAARRSARRRSDGPARPRSSRWPRSRRSRSSSRRGRGPSCGSDRTEGPRTRAGAAGSRVQAPEQEVDRVQDRRGVRLDRHAVGRLEVREPQRGHERDHRRARGLVAADLDPAGVQAARGWRGGRWRWPATARGAGPRRGRRGRPPARVYGPPPWSPSELRTSVTGGDDWSRWSSG